MAYPSIRPDIERIIRRTRDTDGLPRASADIEKELGERALKRAETEEGSGKKGELEQAVSHLETSYQRFPDPEVARLLRNTYSALGDVKKRCGMPGYEADYDKSRFYEEQAKSKEMTHRSFDINHRKNR